jgi:hypothetical protein
LSHNQVAALLLLAHRPAPQIHRPLLQAT